jgi:adenosylcobinamide kinase/adenosylcobinamide-phosphate guanylyltransferase
MKSMLVLGGSRSGKSSYAARLALLAAPDPIYVATSRCWDEDHSSRIARHKRDRGEDWTTIECEKELSLAQVGERVVVVDCMTLWLTNYFVDQASDADAALAEAICELEKLFRQERRWVFVSNELGLGVHAPTEVGRKFADIHGLMNQFLARHVDSVVLMVAGHPVWVKGEDTVSEPALAGGRV